MESIDEQIQKLKPFHTPESQLMILRKMMEKFHELMEEENLQYFIDGGTSLGSIRHKDIIPTDDDIDLGMLKKDFNSKAFSRVLTRIKKYTIDFENEDETLPKTTKNIQVEKPKPYMTKIFIADFWLQNKETKRLSGTPTIDIFCWKETKTNKIILESPLQRTQYPNCFYSTNEFFPLKLYDFSTFKVFGVKDPLPYLNRYYGSDCLTTIKVDDRSWTKPNP